MDWASRLRDGRSLIPDLPLVESEADLGLAIFDAFFVSGDASTIYPPPRSLRQISVPPLNRGLLYLS